MKNSLTLQTQYKQKSRRFIRIIVKRFDRKYIVYHSVHDIHCRYTTFINVCAGAYRLYFIHLKSNVHFIDRQQ